MENTSFHNRVFGCAIIKALNSNYNADFTHQPRTLPNGVAYATDKALKYTLRNYFLSNFPQEKVLFFKRLDEELKPRSLDETYQLLFGEFEKSKKGKEDEVVKTKVLSNLLQCLDVRLFGATYAGATNISVHGTVQINHGVNRFPESVIYSEQIMSPFRNSSEKSKDSEMTTLGSQSKLAEGHYVHHFSVNPQNIKDHSEKTGQKLTQADIDKLKEALRAGATLYDSASKAGTENELLLWVQLKEGAKLVLPNFTELISVTRSESVQIDLSKVAQLLSAEHVKSQIEKIELYYNQVLTQVNGAPADAVILPL